MFNNLTLINAVPGAGKTTFMINKAAELIWDKYDTSEIAFVTFTKNAAQVARDRITERLGEKRGVDAMFGKNSKRYRHFCTIHSMCFHALNISGEDMVTASDYQEFNEMYGYRRFYLSPEAVKYGAQCGGYDVRVMKQDNASLLEQLAGLYRTNKHAYQEAIAGMHIAHAGITNEHVVQYMTRWEEYKKSKSDITVEEFNDYKLKRGVYDYTDLLEEYVRRRLSEDIIKVAFIDEAQDLSYLQWQVLMMAFRNAEEVYAVADPRQNMFKWAGSAVDVFLSLHGTVHTLDKNYRCRRNIVNFVNEHIVRHIENVDSLEIHMEAEREGGNVSYIYFMNDILKDEDITNPSKKVLMLAPDNIGAGVFRDWCINACIPFTWMGSPLFTSSDKSAYVANGRNIPDSWEGEKRLVATAYHNAGTLLATPTVHIMTIHQAKGDEADVVVVNTDMPKKMYESFIVNPYHTDLLFYVACTRAKDTLYIFRDATKSNARRYNRI